MDIKKLTEETILKNMTPEQQKAVLESVMASVKESKQVRTQKIAENDKVQQTGQKVLTIIEQKLDSYVDQGVKEATKRAEEALKGDKK